MWEWRYSCTIFDLGHYVDVYAQLYAPAALSPGKEPPLSVEQVGWVRPRIDLDAAE
jgi:hypothetical protein